MTSRDFFSGHRPLLAASTAPGLPQCFVILYLLLLSSVEGNRLGLDGEWRLPPLAWQLRAAAGSWQLAVSTCGDIDIPEYVLYVPPILQIERRLESLHQFGIRDTKNWAK